MVFMRLILHRFGQLNLYLASANIEWIFNSFERDISNTFSQVFENGKLVNTQQLVLIQIAMDMHIAHMQNKGTKMS